MKSNRIPVILTVLLTLALAISVGVNLFLFNQGRQYYHQLNLTRLDPLGLSVYPAPDDDNANSAKLRVVFFGDSRAYQWPEPSGLKRFEFINRGIGAQTSAQVAERFDEHIVPLHPDMVLIQMGINDLKTISLFPHLKASIVSNCKDNIRRSVQEARDQGATVILTTIFPLGKVPLERRLFWSDDVGQAINEVNEFIYSLQGEQVILFDTGQVLADEQGLVREEYSRDFLHVNDAGYQALNGELVDILAAHVESE